MQVVSSKLSQFPSLETSVCFGKEYLGPWLSRIQVLVSSRCHSQRFFIHAAGFANGVDCVIYYDKYLTIRVSFISRLLATSVSEGGRLSAERRQASG